jgi:hypothetical protein
MPATLKVMANLPKLLANKEVDWDTDTIKIKLLTDAAAPNISTWIYTDASPGNGGTEVTDTGYTAGGATLSHCTSSLDAATNTVKFDADDVSWNNSNITTRYAIIYDSTPTSNKPIIAYIDFGANLTSVNSAFTISWSSSGIFAVQVI